MRLLPMGDSSRGGVSTATSFMHPLGGGGRGALWRDGVLLILLRRGGCVMVGRRGIIIDEQEGWLGLAAALVGASV